MNQTKKMKRAKQKKNRRAIKAGNGHNNPWEPSKKVRETMEGRIFGKGKFWVWCGTEMSWCIVKVVMMAMMMNRWDEMTVRLISDRLAKFFGKFIPETRW